MNKTNWGKDWDLEYRERLFYLEQKPAQERVMLLREVERVALRSKEVQADIAKVMEEGTAAMTDDMLVRMLMAQAQEPGTRGQSRMRAIVEAKRVRDQRTRLALKESREHARALQKDLVKQRKLMSAMKRDLEKAQRELARYEAATNGGKRVSGRGKAAEVDVSEAFPELKK